jgi:hypothetical protein
MKNPTMDSFVDSYLVCVPRLTDDPCPVWLGREFNKASKMETLDGFFRNSRKNSFLHSSRLTKKNP